MRRRSAGHGSNFRRIAGRLLVAVINAMSYLHDRAIKRRRWPCLLHLVNQLAVPCDWFYLICGSVCKGMRIDVDWDKSPFSLHRHCDKDNVSQPPWASLSISIHSHSYINNSYQQEASGKAFFTSPFFSGGPR